MNLASVVILAIVVLAALWVMRRMRRRGGGACRCSGCDCAASCHASRRECGIDRSHKDCPKKN